ncbi:hypothetical protein, partial [Klebsiella pneumoniae]|uniref:hypothetical protein n=1 Tax=Klebsiella pneumoniae TaxID=573 RepID=UPI001E525A05
MLHIFTDVGHLVNRTELTSEMVSELDFGGAWRTADGVTWNTDLIRYLNVFFGRTKTVILDEDGKAVSARTRLNTARSTVIDSSEDNFDINEAVVDYVSTLNEKDRVVVVVDPDFYGLDSEMLEEFDNVDVINITTSHGLTKGDAEALKS